MLLELKAVNWNLIFRLLSDNGKDVIRGERRGIMSTIQYKVVVKTKTKFAKHNFKKPSA